MGSLLESGSRLCFLGRSHPNLISQKCGIGHVPSQCPNRDPPTIRSPRQAPQANFADYRSQASTSWLPVLIVTRDLISMALTMLNPIMGSTLMKKTSITVNSHSESLGSDSMAISSPVRHVVNASGEHSQLEKSSSANSMHDTAENLRNTIGFTAANDGELIRLEQSATKAQAAFRGYLARRAFWALKGIIRLQAVARGHLVRRQAVATLTCMRAIVEFQALVRGQKVRRSGNGPQAVQKRAHGNPLHKERAKLLQISLKSEKLSNNAFGVKLVTSSKTTAPLNIHYDPDEPNSVKNWLERWSSSNFWDPLPQPKKTLNIKPKRKQTKSQSHETKTTRTKRSIRKVPAPSLDNNNNLSENENETNEKKTRKRGGESLPAKQVCSENVLQNTPTVPSYMAATESAKAKLRAQAAAKAAEDGVENGIVRRHSLPDTTGKLGLQSPRVQKLLHANGKGVGKTKKPQISPEMKRWSRQGGRGEWSNHEFHVIRFW